MANKRKPNGGRHRGAVIYTPIAALLVLFIIIFGVSVFFRVTAIEVTGSSRYTADEIIAASGIEPGDNLFLIDRDAAARRITTAMPYIADIRVEPKIPDTAIIVVTESVAFAAILSGGDYWIIDSTGRALERTDFTGTAGLIRVSGMSLLSPKEGAKIEVDSVYETQLGFLRDVLTAIETANIGSQVTNLDVSNISAITFTYKGSISVRLGGGDNAESKLKRLILALEKHDPDFKGTVDVSKEDSTNVIPG